MYIVIVYESGGVIRGVRGVIRRGSRSGVFVPFAFSRYDDGTISSRRRFVASELGGFFCRQGLFSRESPLYGSACFFNESRIIRGLCSQCGSKRGSKLFKLEGVNGASILCTLREQLGLEGRPILFVSFRSLRGGE